MCGIPLALGGSAHLSMCREDGALCEERFTVLVPSSVTGVSSWGRGGSWLGCQVLLAISVVSILELASNSGNFGMS